MAQLVERASRPEVMFGQPDVYDSLLTRVAEGGESSARQLLEYADTPWGWRFEVVRRGLQMIGEPARRIILKRLKVDDRPESEAIKNLVLFEKLGRAGDEFYLVAYLTPGGGGKAVTALRCLAAFGEMEKSLELVRPLLASEDSHVRLAAVWTVGELCRKNKLPDKKTERLVKSVRLLLEDPIPQIRLTAAETLLSLGSAPVPALRR